MGWNPLYEGFDSFLKSYVPIDLAGSVASGKSRFLSLLHAALGYDKAGLPLHKETVRTMPNNKRRRSAQDRRRKGIVRSNATDSPDWLTVYSWDGRQAYGFKFFAPGGHQNAVKFERPAEAMLYFIDLGLAHFVTTLEKEWIYKFGDRYHSLEISDADIVAGAISKNLQVYREIWGMPPISVMKQWAGIQSDAVNRIDELAEVLSGTAVNLPNFGLLQKDDTRDNLNCVRYKRELLGLVVQSAMDSHARVEAAHRQGVPVVGVCTHKNEAYNTLPRDLEDMLHAVEDNLNSAVTSFARYCQLHEINITPERVELEGLGVEWHLIEQVGRVESGEGGGSRPNIKGYRGRRYANNELPIKDKTPIIEVAHSVMSRALESKGIDAKGLRIAGFNEPKSGLTVPYHPTIPAMIA